MRKIILLLFFVLGTPPSGLADNPLDQCISAHTQCTSDCLLKDSLGAQAACVATCAGVQATCAGQVGLSDSQPFIEKKAGQLENFLKDWLGDFLPTPKSTKEIPPEKGAET